MQNKMANNVLDHFTLLNCILQKEDWNIFLYYFLDSFPSCVSSILSFGNSLFFWCLLSWTDTLLLFSNIIISFLFPPHISFILHSQKFPQLYPSNFQILYWFKNIASILLLIFSISFSCVFFIFKYRVIFLWNNPIPCFFSIVIWNLYFLFFSFSLLILFLYLFITNIVYTILFND